MEPPQETNRPFSTLDNRSGQVQVLSPTPLLQRNPYSSPDIMHIKGSEASSVPYALNQGTTALPKNKNQEGTGHRLLNLKPLQKITEPSMFMNLAPPPERTDPVTKVITPQTVEYPAFLSPDLNVTVGTPAVQSSNQPSAVRLEKLQQQPRERLEKMKKEYRNLNTWIDKANYLESILMPKLEHKDSEETNTDEASENMKSNQPEEELENIVGVGKKLL
ncbi:C2CD6 isoform 6 [Pan troglodytes]|uniref:C2CD6 isoform 6 n=1 Tax=Pan troglodytes TaxID=9598 RepID=A0A2J8N596_PANTR|nr:C2CD6 isoform 6 [Pan troglodytes]